jgi:hypothetical protein
MVLFNVGAGVAGIAGVWITGAESVAEAGVQQLLAGAAGTAGYSDVAGTAAGTATAGAATVVQTGR